MIWKKLVVVFLSIFITVVSFGQSIAIQNFTGGSYAAGASIAVPLKVSGCF
jgi:hypothetical protein